ncbi:MAG: zinc ribbon domain-containing protein [Promethearchaeota archaeon]
MERSAPKWFGFTLTQKQSVSIFVFALIGLLICVLVFVTAFTSIIMNFYFYYSDPYYIMDDSYFIIIIISQLPLLIFFFVIFVICCYTLSRCRKTAKYYNQYRMYPQGQTYVPRTPQIETHKMKSSYNEATFCQNCGSRRRESQKFCVNCGIELT